MRFPSRRNARFRKKLVFREKKKSAFWAKKALPGSLPFYVFCNEFVWFLHPKKVHFLAPFWLCLGRLMFPKPCFLQWIWSILEVSFLIWKNAEKWEKQVKMASSPAVMVPDSTGHSIPIRTYAKKVCQPQTSKKLKFRCRPYPFLFRYRSL